MDLGPGTTRRVRVPVPVLVLVLVLLGVCAAQLHPSVPSVPSVPPPENVTVHCADQRPLVTWDHSSERPTTFTVCLLWENGRSVSAQTAARELDLSEFVWSSSEQIFSFLYVTVTANQGPARSKPRPSPSFSYRRFKTARVKCHLEFPEVVLVSDGEEAALSFENPLHLLPELRAIEDAATLSLSVSSMHGAWERRCGPERVCRFSLDLPADACVNLTGTVTHAAGDILLLRRQPVCAAASAASAEKLWLAAILAVVVFVCVISLLVVGIVKYRAFAFPKTPTPRALLRDTPPASRVPDAWSPGPAALRSETYSSVQITGTRTGTILDPESPEPLQVQDEDQGLIQDKDQGLIQSEDYLDDSAESTKTETVSLHSLSGSDTEPSNYERRGALIDLSGDRGQDHDQGQDHLIEIGLSGDVVRGYTG